ncbi:MAG: UvrD-helicase domain-containing protein, partial [Planctomycetota bacterium]
DTRLRRQLALVDAAQISTIHAFCLWLVRRWFTHVDLDPTAVVLDADEASLLKKEVLDDLLNQLYATTSKPDDPLGGKTLDPTCDDPPPADAIAAWDLGKRSLTSLGPAFVRLVDDYGLGEDRDIAAAVLRLYGFTTSLPDPAAWLGEAVESLSERPELVVLEIAAALRTELQRQVEHCAQLVETLQAGDPVGYFYADKIRDYENALHEWNTTLASGDRQSVTESLARFDRVREQINGFEFSKEQTKRLGKDTDPTTRAARDAASDLYSKQVKERLFKKRLKNRFALFSREEWTSGLRQTAPYVAALVDVVAAFQDAYARRKRRLNVLDFADLERFAFDLLRPADGSDGPSDVARTLHDRFAHVLVDEFQDINPLQQAILTCVSRESDPTRPGNLFVVGDVKQSIYRFRLAEPGLFTERLRGFSAKSETENPLTLPSPPKGERGFRMNSNDSGGAA